VAFNYQLVPAQKHPVRSDDWGSAGTQKKTTTSLMSFFLPENARRRSKIRKMNRLVSEQ
jgi:hypothetical protein